MKKKKSTERTTLRDREEAELGSLVRVDFLNLIESVLTPPPPTPYSHKFLYFWLLMFD